MDKDILNDYKNRYHDMVVALSRSEIVSAVSEELLTDFPRNLPEKLVKRFAFHLRVVGEGIRDHLQEFFDKDGNPTNTDRTDSKRVLLKCNFPDTYTRILTSFLKASVSLTVSGKATRNIELDFIPFVNSQQLVMIFSFLDSFLSDSLRVVCTARPEIMKSDKKMDWKTILEQGSWDRLNEYMVEDYVFASGWGSISDRVQKMRDRLGLRIDVSEDLIERIGTAELIRNIIVHNGGRVSGEYLKKSGRSDVRIGEPLTIERHLVQVLANDSMELSSNILLDILEVHFKLDRSSFSGFRRVSKPPSGGISDDLNGS